MDYQLPFRSDLSFTSLHSALELLDLRTSKVDRVGDFLPDRLYIPSQLMGLALPMAYATELVVEIDFSCAPDDWAVVREWMIKDGDIYRFDVCRVSVLGA